jgi:hypothetical protein
MLLVDAINLGLHLGMPALEQDGEFTHQPSRARSRIGFTLLSAGQATASAVNASLSELGRAA